MAKPWDKLNDSEKIERLRQELDDAIRRLNAYGAGFDDLYSRLKALEDRVALEPAEKP